jgi:zinc and cadmium transporter
LGVPIPLLVAYCLLILLASLVGGWVPLVVSLTHRRLELAVSFVSGVMLGVGVLHLLPHAWLYRVAGLRAAGDPRAEDALDAVLLLMLAGFVGMFLLERFFCHHHHEAPADTEPGRDPGCRHHDGHPHRHRLTWAGAGVGLVAHSLVAGAALAAAVASETSDTTLLAGLGTFLVIFLHKPFDSLTLGTLMASGGWSVRARHLVNALFALAIPVGAGVFWLGPVQADVAGDLWISAVLAFSAGMFLCIALSDLLPELQFHRHDRLGLSVAMILGLALAWGVGKLEGQDHGHEHEIAVQAPAAVGPGVRRGTSAHHSSRSPHTGRLTDPGGPICLLSTCSPSAGPASAPLPRGRVRSHR